MYKREIWVDHVTDSSGVVIQQGTLQDQAHFNNIEEGIMDAHIAVSLLQTYARQNAWEIERGTVTLTNTSKYPFNNSLKSVAMALGKESGDYAVLTEVSEFTGNVGEIVVSDKLANGFKIAFTGSASSVTINYSVVGGYLK